MSESEATESGTSHSTDEKKGHFTQAGNIREPALNQLRDQIKKVMIPLLIKTFQLKLELSQSISLPSRLQKNKSQQSLDEITEQLNQLDKDLNVLMLWCQSSRGQITKALAPEEEEPKSAIASPTQEPSNPAVLKSFSNAVSSQPPHPHSTTLDEIRDA
ncbi:MAG: hypothetical protein V4492_04465, partial [Chlamydiota bacterium]